MFGKHGTDGYVDAGHGARRKTLVYGDSTLMVEIRLPGNQPLPAHSHPHEQIGYMVTGRIRMSFGGETFEVEPGDSWCIPGGVEHQSTILEDSVVIEVFSPVREEYLPG